MMNQSTIGLPRSIVTKMDSAIKTIIPHDVGSRLFEKSVVKNHFKMKPCNKYTYRDRCPMLVKAKPRVGIKAIKAKDTRKAIP